MEQLCIDIKKCISEFNGILDSSQIGKDGKYNYWITTPNSACFSSIIIKGADKTTPTSGVYFKDKKSAINLAIKIKKIFARYGYDEIEILDKTQEEQYPYFLDGQTYYGEIEDYHGHKQIKINNENTKFIHTSEPIGAIDIGRPIQFEAHCKPDVKNPDNKYWYATNVRIKEKK